MINNVIDISHYQTVTSFDVLKSNGIDAIIHKATQGIGGNDGKYINRRDYIRESKQFLFGSYHFLSHASGGAEQAKHFFDTVQPVPGEILVCDWELDNGTLAGVNVVKDFMDELKGLAPENTLMVYCSDSVAIQYRTFLENYNIWVARYGNTPHYDNWILWQYSESAAVEGIGTCDRNRYKGTVEELGTFWGQEIKELQAKAENPVEDTDSTNDGLGKPATDSIT